MANAHARAMTSAREMTNAHMRIPQRRGNTRERVGEHGARARRAIVIASANESEVFRAWDRATKSQKRTDIKKIMILGAGPIVIGQVRRYSLVAREREKGRENQTWATGSRGEYLKKFKRARARWGGDNERPFWRLRHSRWKSEGGMSFSSHASDLKGDRY